MSNVSPDQFKLFDTDAMHTPLHERTGQLPMFMTAREIKRKYQPLDADREDISFDHEGDDAEKIMNAYPSLRLRRGGVAFDDEASYRRRGQPGHEYVQEIREENDDEMWDRKATEASDDGLTQSLREHGVRSPVSLSLERGRSGLPQVAGGHHRIAAMDEEAPDELLPVVHHRQFHDAKAEMDHFGGYNNTRAYLRHYEP